MTTLEIARRVLARRLGIAESEVTLNCRRTLDAATKAELLREMEHAFGVRFSEDLGPLDTVGAIVAAVAWEMAQSRAGATENGS